MKSVAEIQAIYDAALAGRCFLCESALNLSEVRDWAEECPDCGRRYHARDGYVVLSEPIEGELRRNVAVLKVTSRERTE